MIILNENTSTINADNMILGRMASIIAKRLLCGERVIVVNAEKVVISGKKKNKVILTKNFLKVGHPRKGPFHYKRPDQIVKKTIKGMLPHRQAKGKQAYKRLQVFSSIPQEFKDIKMEKLAEAMSTKLKCPYFYLGDLAKEIGWGV